MDSTAAAKVSQWLESPFLKIDPQAWREVGAASFTLAAMTHATGKSGGTPGTFYGQPSKVAKLVGYDARRVRQHREKLRRAGYLAPMTQKRGAFPCDAFTEKALAPLKGGERWVRVPLCELAERKPSASLMVLGGLLRRGQCLSKRREDLDWTFYGGPQYAPVVSSAAALAERCGVSRDEVRRELRRLQAAGVIDVEQRPRTRAGKFVRDRIKFVDWPEPTTEEEPTIPMANHAIPKVAHQRGYTLLASIGSPVADAARFAGRRHPSRAIGALPPWDKTRPKWGRADKRSKP